MKKKMESGNRREFGLWSVFAGSGLDENDAHSGEGNKMVRFGCCGGVPTASPRLRLERLAWGVSNPTLQVACTLHLPGNQVFVDGPFEFRANEWRPASHQLCNQCESEGKKQT